MPRIFESFGLFLRAPDPRPAREIERDIEDELRFHLEESADDARRAGLSDEAARSSALARFGDVDRVRTACRRAQLGERLMLQRIQFGLVLATLGSVAVMGWKSFVAQRQSEEELRATRATLALMRDEVADLALAMKSQPPGAPAPAVAESDARRGAAEAPEEDELASETWRRRFEENREDWRHGMTLAWRLAALPHEQALAILREIYAGLSLAHREQVLKPFVGGAGSPEAVHFLHLAATDPEPSVRGRAFELLKRYAFQDFSGDVEAYERWHERWGQAPLAEVLAANAKAFLARVRTLSGEDLAKELRTFDRLDLSNGEAADMDLPSLLRQEGALELLGAWLEQEDADVQRTAMRWLPALEPDRPTVEALVLPVLANWQERDGNVVGEACGALGRRGQTWAVEPLVDFLRVALEGSEEHRKMSWSGARALAEIGDQRAVPALIGMIAADGTYDTVYGLGWFGLHDLTGVAYDESHDGAWWLAWWEANRGRLPEVVRALPVPSYTFAR